MNYLPERIEMILGFIVAYTFGFISWTEILNMFFVIHEEPYTLFNIVFYVRTQPPAGYYQRLSIH